MIREKEVRDPAGELAGIGTRGVAQHKDRELLLGETKRIGPKADESTAVGNRREPAVLAEPEAARVVLDRAVVETPRSHQAM